MQPGCTIKPLPSIRATFAISSAFCQPKSSISGAGICAKNTSKGNGSFAVLYDALCAYCDHNRGQGLGAKGLNPFYTGYTALVLLL
jgi:hypothetical protein